MTVRILVAGIGNLFLGDDGFGPEVVHRLLDEGAMPADVRVVDYGIRGMHLAYDLLDGYEALVLVDTIPGSGAAGGLTVLEVGRDELGTGGFDAHAMDPVAVLSTVDRLGGTVPPTYVVGCQPASLAEGIGLSGPVRAAIPAAIDAVTTLVERLVSQAVAGRA